MFVQVIKGRTSDPAGLLAQLERWRTDVKPGAVGFVGSTVGIADDGTLVAIARFTDADAAQRNSSRPEQGEWWRRTAELLEGEATFRDSTDASVVFDVGAEGAGFVQVMEGVVDDRAAAEAFETPAMVEELRRARPDLLCVQRVWFGDDAFVEAAYFTSEAAAREGEASADFTEAQEEYAQLFGETTYIDLRSPLLD